MNQTKLLNIMPYVLGVLILVLVAVIILTGMGDGTPKQPQNNQNQSETAKNNQSDPDYGTIPDKGTPDTNSTTAAPDDGGNSGQTNEEAAPTATPTLEPTPTEAPTPTPTTAPTPTPITDLTMGYTFEPKADYVDTKDGVNLRLGASTDTEVVTMLEEGQRLERTGYNDEWTRVIYDGQECYIATRLVIRAVESMDTVVEPTPVPEEENDGEEETAGDNAGEEGRVSYYGAGAGKTVCIDPGHQKTGISEKEPVGPGSSETKPKCSSGTAGNYTGIEEYVLDLEVSLMLKRELEARGYNVIMTRTSHDVSLSNIERAQIANASGADAFVRVHADSSEKESVSGIMTMCMTPDSPYNSSIYSKSRSLSNCILTCMVDRTGARERGVMETDDYSGINWSEVPVTIVEMGLMSNEKEDKLMATDAYRQKLATGIADGLDLYFLNQ